MQIVGSVLVRNEDVFVERAIRNVASFCDEIHVVDHDSEDGTAEILRRLADELDHIHVVRSKDAADRTASLSPTPGHRPGCSGSTGTSSTIGQRSRGSVPTSWPAHMRTSFGSRATC